MIDESKWDGGLNDEGKVVTSRTYDRRKKYLSRLPTESSRESYRMAYLLKYEDLPADLQYELSQVDSDGGKRLVALAVACIFTGLGIIGIAGAFLLP